MDTQSKCYMCGETKGFSLDAGHIRLCKNCGATIQESVLAQMLSKYVGGGNQSIRQVLPKIRKKKILNINLNGMLDDILSKNELYQKKAEDNEWNEYPNNYFDFVISQNYIDKTEGKKKIENIDRIMSPQGVHIFITEDVAMNGEGKSFLWDIDGVKVMATHKKMSDIEEYSGERFVPGIEDEKLAIEHMQRYLSIVSAISNKNVVDIACGEGYGTAILAEKASTIIGIDIDKEAIARAREKYQKHNLSYLCGSIAEIPLKDHSVDAIVSLETIEHVSQTLQMQFLNECRRVLKDDGILIMSTPNKEIYSDRYNYFNEYHVHEFYHDEFIDFLHKQFKYIKEYNQSFQIASILKDCDKEKENISYFANESSETHGKYCIAIASNQDIAIPDISSIYMGEEGEYEKNIHRIIDLQIEEEKRNIHIQKLDNEIEFDRKRIVELQNEEQVRNEHIQSLDQQIIELKNKCNILSEDNSLLGGQQKSLKEQISVFQEKEWILKQHKEILEEKNSIIQEEKNILQRKVTILQEENSDLKQNNIEINQSVQEIRLENTDLKQKLQMSQQVNLELQQVKTNFENLVQELDLLKNVKKENEEIQKKNRLYEQEKQNFIQEIRNKEGHIELLLESERELERYKNTKDYQKMLRKRERIDKLLPPSSKRLFILRVLKKMITEPGVMIRVIQPGNIGNYFKYLKSDSIEEIQSRYDELLDIAQGTNSAVMIKMQNSGVVTNQNSSKGVAHKVEDYEMLCFTEQERPLVSIIIPVYNQFDYTYNCLKSILTNSGDVSYEVIIANDCSTDITRDIEQVVKNVRLITTESNVRFLLNCNNAAKYARGQYILFLNNDTQVMENWLKPLIQVMDTYEDVGMVGSKLIYPDGRLQEAGGIVWKDASAWNYGHLKNPDDPEYVYLKEVDYVSGAAIMIRTKLWKEIGGFDERFVPAYYEDTDLAFEVRKHGYKVMMQPKSLVVHFEGVSNGTDTSTGLKAYQVANNQKFYDKWKDVLEKENFENGQDVFLAKDRGQLKKQILVVDHYVPNYDKDAGGRCTYMYIKMFLKMGLKVTFIGDNFAHPEPYTSELNGLGVEILYGNDYYNNWKIWLIDNLHYFDYIYLQRPHISIKYIDIVKKYGRGKIFYFAHDLHHVRMYRDYLLTGDEKALEESEKWKKIEMELFDKTDVGHVVGSYEQAIMQKAFPNKPIRNIPLYIYDEMPEGIEKDFSKRSDILFVGGFGHTPNIDAVLWFYENVYTRVLRKYPDMVWHIVGSKAPDEVLKLAGPNVIIEGFVSDEDLAKLYKKCRMSVVPLRYGAGVKGKVVESAYYQIPLVTTPIGGEGLDVSTDAFEMEEDAEKMAELICNLYEDYPRLKKMSDAGIDFISTYFTSKVAEQVLVQDM